MQVKPGHNAYDGQSESKERSKTPLLNMDSLILSIICLILFIILVLVVAIGPRDHKPVAKPGPATPGTQTDPASRGTPSEFESTQAMSSGYAAARQEEGSHLGPHPAYHLGPYLEPLENAPDPKAVVKISQRETTIGRDPRLVQLVLNDPTMSRIHARIVVRDNNYYLVDENSANGTYVNHEKIGSEPQILHDNDNIYFGRVRMRFRLADPTSSTTQGIAAEPAADVGDLHSAQPYIPHSPQQLPKAVKLRLDVAVPDQVYVGRAFELAVAVRQPLSDLLADKKLPRVRSGDILASPPADRNYIGFRIHISAPHCKIHDRDSLKFRLFLGQDSPVFYFHLTPLKPGELSIIVSVYQKKVQSGSARVHTLAQEEPVGSVSTEVISSNLIPEMEQQDNPIRRELISLYQRLVQYFNEGELKELVFQLGIDYEDLPGQTKRDKVQELIKYLERRDGIEQLVALSKRNRPNVVWQ